MSARVRVSGETAGDTWTPSWAVKCFARHGEGAAKETATNEEIGKSVKAVHLLLDPSTASVAGRARTSGSCWETIMDRQGLSPR